MRHGGKKWSGSHVPIQFSFSSLFLSERDFERVSTRVEKAEEWEQHFHYRRQNEEDDKEDDKEEVDVQRPYLECVEKKEELSIPLTLFRRKTLTYEISQRRSKNIFFARTNRKRPKTRERERKSFLFFLRFFIYLTALPKTVCCFYIRTILRALLR